MVKNTLASVTNAVLSASNSTHDFPCMGQEKNISFLKDANALFDSGDYRIVARKRGGEWMFTTAVIPRIAQNYWNNPSGKPGVWYKLKSDEVTDEGTIIRPFVRTDDKPMNEAQILKWLSQRMGGSQQARIALESLLAAEPETAVA